jgi:hypothetical protein
MDVCLEVYACKVLLEASSIDRLIDRIPVAINGFQSIEEIK